MNGKSKVMVVVNGYSGSSELVNVIEDLDNKGFVEVLRNEVCTFRACDEWFVAVPVMYDAQDFDRVEAMLEGMTAGRRLAGWYRSMRKVETV